jgi:hypothetical protein
LVQFSFGVSLAILFVVIRGCNSANYFMATSELPAFALVAVSSFYTAVSALLASLLLENLDWSRVFIPSSTPWTALAGVLSALSVFAALRSFGFIPLWLTQAFIGFEPMFGILGIFFVAKFVSDETTKQALLQKLPSNWWMFGSGLFLVAIGVALMGLAMSRRA